MKFLKLLASVAVSAALLAVTSCDDEPLEYDPDLGVIVDQNTDSAGVKEVTDFEVTLFCDEDLGRVNSYVEGAELVLSARTRGRGKFIGWYAGEDASGKLLSSLPTARLDSADLQEMAVQGRVSVYAYITERFSISYDTMGGSFVGSVALNSYDRDDYRYELPVNVEKVGCRFVGWRIASTGQIVDVIPHGISGDLELHAVWDDINEDLGYFENSVWRLTAEDIPALADTECILILSPDGTADIFCRSAGKGTPFINSGAVNAMENAISILTRDGRVITQQELIDTVRYDCSKPYYHYTPTADGAELIYDDSVFDLSDSPYIADFPREYWGGFKYLLVSTDEGGVMTIDFADIISYGGVDYDMEGWFEFLSGVSLEDIDVSAIGFEFGTSDLEITMELISEDVTDYEFRSYSAGDTPYQTYLDDDGFSFVKDTNLYFNIEKDRYNVAFFRDGAVIVAYDYARLGEMAILQVFVYEDPEGDLGLVPETERTGSQ